MDEQLFQLYRTQRELSRENTRLRLQLAHLQCEETDCFLDFYHSSGRKDRAELEDSKQQYQIAHTQIQSNRDIVLSELVEVRLLLGHVLDQINTYEPLPTT